MGYRNYFYLAEKAKVDDFLSLSDVDKVSKSFANDLASGFFTQEDIDKFIQHNKINIFGLKEDILSAKEICCCGKYFDSDITQQIVQDGIDYSNDDCEFYFVKPEALLICAKHYRDCAIKYYKNVIRSLDMTDEECEQDMDLGFVRPNLHVLFRCMIGDLQSVDFSQTQNDQHLIDTCQYDYDMFNLMFLYQTIDWEKHQLIWCGY